MKTLILILTIIITLGFSLAIAEEPMKTEEVLKLELQVLQVQAQAKVNARSAYFNQVEFLRLKIPAVEAEINELNAQIRKKVSEITRLQTEPEPVAEVKETPAN